MDSFWPNISSIRRTGAENGASSCENAQVARTETRVPTCCPPSLFLFRSSVAGCRVCRFWPDRLSSRASSLLAAPLPTCNESAASGWNARKEACCPTGSKRPATVRIKSALVVQATIIFGRRVVQHKRKTECKNKCKAGSLLKAFCKGHQAQNSTTQQWDEANVFFSGENFQP